MNILEKTLELMENDDAPTGKQSEYINSIYENANDIQQGLIDDTFIALCGYSLKSIINNECN